LPREVVDGQTGSVIDPRFIYLASLISLAGGVIYIRDTLLGYTAPNRVTWSLWGFLPLLAFAVERQNHVGISSLFTLMLGLVPIAIVIASFRNPNAVWQIGRFDLVCGAISLLGVAVWLFIDQPTIALVTFVFADVVAALPTLRKSYREPETESGLAFAAGTTSAALTMLTLNEWTTISALFPLAIFLTDIVLTLLVLTKLGPRLTASRQRVEGVAVS